MRSLVRTLCVSAIIGVCPALAIAALHYTTPPPGTVQAQGGDSSTVACDTQIRYDDGIDDNPISDPTLGWYTPFNFQNLGVRFTSPSGQNHRVQSASWFSGFWLSPGLVDVTAMEANNPANSVTVTVNVTGSGTWGVEFPNPIIIPDGADYVIMLCPQPGVLGVLNDDLSAPDDRSYFSPSACTADYLWGGRISRCGPASNRKLRLRRLRWDSTSSPTR